MASQVASNESPSDSETSSSESEEEETITEPCEIETFISRKEVEENYLLMDKTLTPDISPLVLSKLRSAHPEAFSPASEGALAAAIIDLNLPFPLSDFQIFSVNCLLNKKDLLCVVPTGQKCIFLIAFTVKTMQLQNCSKNHFARKHEHSEKYTLLS